MADTTTRDLIGSYLTELTRLHDMYVDLNEAEDEGDEFDYEDFDSEKFDVLERLEEVATEIVGRIADRDQLPAWWGSFGQPAK